MGSEMCIRDRSYHMPRSVYEFKKNAPDIMIYPWNIFHKEKTILDNIEKLTLEYLKYNLIRLQYLFKKNYSYEN